MNVFNNYLVLKNLNSLSYSMWSVSRNCISKMPSTFVVVQSIEGQRRKFSSNSPKRQIVKSLLPDIEITKSPISEYMLNKFDKYSDRIALECTLTQRHYRYHELTTKSQALAANLRNIIGIQDKDPVLVVLPNIPEYAIIVLGIIQANGVFSPCNPAYTAEEIKRQFINSDSTCIVTSNELYPVIREAVNLIGKNVPVIVYNTENEKIVPENTYNLATLMNSKTDTNILRTLQKPQISDTCIMPYSSGTTGLPKGVEITHENVISVIEMIQNSNGHINAHFAPEYQIVTPGILPFYHIFGMSAILLEQLTSGAKIPTVSKFSIDNFIQVLRNYKPDCLYVVPPLFLLLTLHPDITSEDLKNLRMVLSGAAPLGKNDIEQLELKVGSKDKQMYIMQGYGLTETAALVCVPHKLYDNWDKAAVGGLVSNTKAKIVDFETGKALGPGEKGELVINGPQIMKGYYKNPKATEDVFPESRWFRTGDQGYYDERGQFFISDRLKDLIKVKGYQVPPAELEEILRSHPSIVDAAVIGVPHPISGEVPKAFVVKAPKKNITEKDVEEFVASKVAPFKKLTGGVEFVPSIPKSAAGKILKLELKKQYLNN